MLDPTVTEDNERKIVISISPVSSIENNRMLAMGLNYVQPIPT